MTDEAHATKNSDNAHDYEEESETIQVSSLNETYASQMTQYGFSAEPIPIGSLNLEHEDYYNNDIGSNPSLITNRGCIKIKDKEISMIHIIQRN